MSVTAPADDMDARQRRDRRATVAGQVAAGILGAEHLGSASLVGQRVGEFVAARRAGDRDVERHAAMELAVEAANYVVAVDTRT